MDFKVLDLSINSIPLEEVRIFYGPYDGVQRYDRSIYSVTERLTELQQAQRWFPKELNYNKDRITINSDRISEGLKTIYQKNLAFQTLADSYANRYLDNLLSERCTSPEWERVLKWQSNYELLHSESYSENIKVVYTDPQKFFDDALQDVFIRDRLNIELNIINDFIDAEKYTIRSTDKAKEAYEKQHLLRTIFAQYALENIRFMVSFLYTFKIHEVSNYSIPGTFNAIGLIAHDEFIHTVIFKHLINILRSNKKEGFTEVFSDDDLIKIFNNIIKSEKQWFRYLSGFEEIPGMNEEHIEDFLHYFANEALEQVKIEPVFERKLEEPTPLIDFFLKKRDLAAKKVLAQENDTTSYTIGALIDEDPEDVMDIEKRSLEMEQEWLG